MDNRKDGERVGGEAMRQQLKRPSPARQRKRAQAGGAGTPPPTRARIGKAMVDLVLTGKRPSGELVDAGCVTVDEGGVVEGVAGEGGGTNNDAPGSCSEKRRTDLAGLGHVMGPTHAVIPPNPSCVIPEVAGGVVKGAVPLGKPKRKRQTLSARLKSLCRADGNRHAKEIAEALIARAKGEGKTANDAARIVFDRVDGPVVRKVDVQGEMHHRKTIVIRADPELLRRAGENARLVDLDLPDLLPSEVGEEVVDFVDVSDSEE